MITAQQMKAARALLGIDQKSFAMESGVSLATIRRMEASEGNVRANVDTLVKVVQTFENLGLDLISDGTSSLEGGRGVRLRST